MASSRREFMKRVGIGLATLMTARCRLPKNEGNTANSRLRDCWLRLDWLAGETQRAKLGDQGEKARDRLVQDHQSALKELVANRPGADSV